MMSRKQGEKGTVTAVQLRITIFTVINIIVFCSII